jgi:cell division septation protein DedD
MARWRLILAAWIPIVDVQAKDRLTGAVILVVLLVLVVPELLSGPGGKVAAVAAKSSDEPPLRSYTVDLNDETRTRHAPVSGPAAATAPPPVAAVAPAAVPPIATPAPVAEPPPPQQEPVPAAAAPASRVEPEAAPPVAPAGWTVQLGSFASRANAERLVHDLRAKGYAAFSTESASGERKLYRVRVGPAGNHAAAETLAARLRSAGHPGSLTQRP